MGSRQNGLLEAGKKVTWVRSGIPLRRKKGQLEGFTVTGNTRKPWVAENGSRTRFAAEAVRGVRLLLF
jgi:hypothetical protein